MLVEPLTQMRMGRAGCHATPPRSSAIKCAQRARQGPYRTPQRASASSLGPRLLSRMEGGQRAQHAGSIPPSIASDTTAGPDLGAVPEGYRRVSSMRKQTSIGKRVLVFLANFIKADSSRRTH